MYILIKKSNCSFCMFSDALPCNNNVTLTFTLCISSFSSVPLVSMISLRAVKKEKMCDIYNILTEEQKPNEKKSQDYYIGCNQTEAASHP